MPSTSTTPTMYVVQCLTQSAKTTRLGTCQYHITAQQLGPHMCVITQHYSVTLWYPHISPSRLRHGTPVLYSGMGHSRMYVIPIILKFLNKF